MTGASPDDLLCKEISPPGYTIEHVPRTSGRGGGVAVILRSSFKYAVQKQKKYSSFETIEILISTKSDSVRLCVVYRPPGGKHSKPLSTFLEEFENYMDHHSVSPGKLLIVGDFNIHMETTCNNIVRKFKQTFISRNLVQHISTSTHVKGHLLDLVLSRSDEELVSEVNVETGMFSDHFPIVIKCIVNKAFPKTETMKCRNLKSIDKKTFMQDISSSKIFDPYEQDVSNLVKQYNSSLSDILNKHAPETTRKVLVRNHSPWYNSDLRNARQTKRKAERKWRKSGLTVHYEIFNQERKKYNFMCRAAKSAFFKKEIEERKGDQANLYRVMNQLMQKSKNTILPSHQDDQELANDFADYFENKIADISQTSEKPTLSRSSK